MKRTTEKFTSFLGRKLNQAATVLDKSTTRPPRPPSPPSPRVEASEPQHGDPAYARSTVGSSNTTASLSPYLTPPPLVGSNPVSNVTLSSPFPPDSPHGRYHRPPDARSSPAAFALPVQRPHPPRDSPIPPTLLATTHRRAAQASAHFPNLPLRTTRPLDPSNDADVSLFLHQLHNACPDLFAPTTTSAPPSLPTFVLSTPSAHLTPAQTHRLKALFRALPFPAVTLVLPSPAHSRLLPPAVYPVLSLATRTDTLSAEADTSFWPFLEEVAGVWGAGVIYVAESRGGIVAGSRETLRYVSRAALDVPETVAHALRNVFFGAVDTHADFSDVVAEIARWAFRRGVCLGSDWRERVVAGGAPAELFPGCGLFLDGSRTVDGRGVPWESGVSQGVVKKCYWVVTDRGAYYLLNRGVPNTGRGVWVLVGVDGGRVAWSKVMSGPCVVGLNSGEGVERGVRTQVGQVRVVEVRECETSEIA